MRLEVGGRTSGCVARVHRKPSSQRKGRTHLELLRPVFLSLSSRAPKRRRFIGLKQQSNGQRPAHFPPPLASHTPHTHATVVASPIGPSTAQHSTQSSNRSSSNSTTDFAFSRRFFFFFRGPFLFSRPPTQSSRSKSPKQQQKQKQKQQQQRTPHPTRRCPPFSARPHHTHHTPPRHDREWRCKTSSALLSAMEPSARPVRFPFPPPFLPVRHSLPSPSFRSASCCCPCCPPRLVVTAPDKKKKKKTSSSLLLLPPLLLPLGNVLHHPLRDLFLCPRGIPFDKSTKLTLTHKKKKKKKTTASTFVLGFSLSGCLAVGTTL